MVKRDFVPKTRRRGLKSSTLAIIILSVVVLAFIVYFVIGAFNAAQTRKMNNAAILGASVRDVQLFAGSANCQPVFVTAFNEEGVQMQKALMEINPVCFVAYQQTAQQVQAAISQQ